MVCYLKNTKEERSYTSEEGVTSGYPTRFCESSDGEGRMLGNIPLISHTAMCRGLRMKT
uniref:Uncharacterized protein n=1 Tax=Anguilla anguilla TaxID=7936 RepID=A0A0E9UEX7_ANGAN